MFKLFRGHNERDLLSVRDKQEEFQGLKNKANKHITTACTCNCKDTNFANIVENNIDQEIEDKTCQSLRDDGFKVEVVKETKTLHDIRISWGK